MAVDTGAVTHSEADAAYEARAWQRAFELYDGTPDLDARDLDRYAVCAMLLGRMDDYFGQEFQYMFNSHTVGGVGKDAAYVVEQLDREPAAGPKARAGTSA